jgi:REP-associated tyrosine transposase
LDGVPRRRRSFFEGLYHLAPHASDTRSLFLHDEDRNAFLEQLAVTFRRFEIGLVAYTLMGTHYHAVVSIPDGRISAALQQLHTWYSRRQNKPRERTAHLFRAHYAAREITSDEDLLTVCRYLAYNPVVAKIAEHPFDWPWGSAAATAGLARPRVPLDDEPLRGAFGRRRAWRRLYQAFIEDGSGDAR